jgi:predicted neutral ceramidase superfamily lipid hydrolase
MNGTYACVSVSQEITVSKQLALNVTLRFFKDFLGKIFGCMHRSKEIFSHLHAHVRHLLLSIFMVHSKYGHSQCTMFNRC